jgi:hypothetical protein
VPLSGAGLRSRVSLFILAGEGTRQRFPQLAATHARTLEAIVINGLQCRRFVSAPPELRIATHQGSKPMRNGKAAGLDAHVLERLAQIEQMTLDQIAAFQRRIPTEISTRRIAPREASAIDNALRKRLKEIEQELRC